MLIILNYFIFNFRTLILSRRFSLSRFFSLCIGCEVPSAEIRGCFYNNHGFHISLSFDGLEILYEMQSFIFDFLNTGLGSGERFNIDGITVLCFSTREKNFIKIADKTKFVLAEKLCFSNFLSVFPAIKIYSRKLAAQQPEIKRDVKYFLSLIESCEKISTARNLIINNYDFDHNSEIQQELLLTDSLAALFSVKLK